MHPDSLASKQAAQCRPWEALPPVPLLPLPPFQDAAAQVQRCQRPAPVPDVPRSVRAAVDQRAILSMLRL